jgi:glycosyltransferase involved in cell wall biosynthesis
MNLRAISVVVTTFNEEQNLGRCLDSVRDFADVVVVDSYSTDGTLDIARGYPVRVLSHTYDSAARQKNWALQQVQHDWVLILDADEVLTPELRRDLEALEEPPPCAGYWVRRRSEYLGRPIRHCGWQRDRVLRFFRRDRGLYEEREVHEEVIVNGAVGRLTGRLLHYPYPDLAQHCRKIDSYTTRGARDFVHRGGRWPLVRMLVHPPFRFLRMYVLQAGFRDGLPGLVLCLLSAYSVMLKYAKAWEYARLRQRGAS